DAHHEGRTGPAARLYEPLQPDERSGNDTHTVPDPEPRHGTDAVAGGDDAAGGLDLVPGDWMAGHPPGAAGPHGTGRAHRPDVRITRRHEAQEQVARKERPLEDHATITPPARHPQARQEGLHMLPAEALFHLRLALAAGPYRVPALVGRTLEEGVGERPLA